MYEGKNIHYSQSADQKPLCSFSGKICNQRRLNHYGFCVRHILEDPTAPFKRCAYVAKSSGQTCTQPIPKNEEREYCNNHMQVLGMLPKKERKPKKEKDRLGTVSSQFYLEGAKADPGLLQNKIRPRPLIGNTKSKLIASKMSVGGEEMDDIYAFPTDSSESRVKELTAVFSSVTLPNVSVTVSPIHTLGANVTKSQVDAGQSSLAKIYPELAEKLEKIKPKVEAKTKGKVKSSRTMNSLQTKIAQNKIKDKLKRNQCSSNTSSQSQSPSHSYTNSPGYQINTSSPNHPAQSPGSSAPPNVTVVKDGLNSVVGSMAASGVSSTVNTAPPPPSLSQLSVLNGLNLQTLNLSLEQLGLPVPTVSDIEQTLKQLASAANIPLEGNAVYNNETGIVSGASEPQTGHILPPAPELQHLLPQPFSQQSKPPPPYSSVHHKPTNEVLQTSSVSNVLNTVTQTEQGNKQTVKNEFILGHQIRPVKMSVTASLPSPSQMINVPFVTKHLPTASPSGAKLVPTCTTALSSSTSSLAASLSSPLLPFPQHPKLTLLTTSQSSNNSVLSKSLESAKQTPAAVFQQPRTKPVKSRPRSRNPSTTKRPVPLLSVPMTLVKPRKIRKLLDDEDVKKLKTKSAIEYYNQNKRKKISRHYMVCSSVASSDESDVSDCDMLPWQPDWFRASSDEEAPDDEEENDYALRTAKLALGRARLRRQCSQARLSSRLNHSLNLTTSDLISAARESSRSTVRCLKEIRCIKEKSPERLKSKGLVKRRCLYRNDEEKQCKNNVVPYTNHCIKHVMYNVDQQLFEYCTAKFADNTQCCHPVIDVKHELPLCMEHGVKADNFLKAQDLEPKPKRPRKKTKPSALTRPPKKGKKKKNQRKNVRPQKPIPPELETQEALESESEDISSQPQTVMNADSDSDKGESQSSATDVPDSEKSVPQLPVPSQPEPSINRTSMVVKDGVKVGNSGLKHEKKSGSASQLEELDNLTSLSELENVKMFGDLETASKLLEENDFQEVFSRLPDVAFDIFSSKSSGLPGTDELQDFEDTLALENRELKMNKNPHEPVAPSSKTQSTRQPIQPQTSLVSQTLVTPALSQPQAPVAPILEDSDDLTRQIAEEIMKQNIGPSTSMGGSLCNGDAEESIKAIARSLSNSGMMLAAEAKHKVQSQEVFTSNQSSQSLSRTQSLPLYSNLDSMYYPPPNVAIQNIPSAGGQQVSGLVQTSVMSKGPVQHPGQVSYTGQMSTNVVPQNVTVTPQGIITSHIGSSRLAPSTQTVTIGNTTVTGNQNAGIITLPVPQQLTAQQLSALVQQATAHLPPLPPYTPRQQAPAPVSTPSQPAQVVSVASPRPLSQEQLIQHLAKQQEQLGEQQQLLAQQILQQRLAVLTQQTLPVKVTLPSTQHLGFSTILHQGPVAQLGRLNQGVVHAIPNIGQITQMIKTTLPTSQKLSAPASLPSTNIVWTSPPNVTITSPNGLPRGVAQTFVSGAKLSTTNPKIKTSTINETYIDLTESTDPPPYESALSSQGKTQPPPSYPAEASTSNTVTGKS